MLLLVFLIGCHSLYCAYSANPPYNGYYQQEQKAPSSYPSPGHSYQRNAYKQPNQRPKIPACAKNTTASFCLEDSEYPTQTVLEEIYRCYKEFLPLYAEVSDQSTENSVDGLNTLEQETYLCQSSTIYGRPLRAKNIDGKWKIIVNVEKYYQTTRLETCWMPGESCPLVSSCYQSSCVQKSIYRRFVTYDETVTAGCRFKINSYKLPVSCSCLVGASEFPA